MPKGTYMYNPNDFKNFRFDRRTRLIPGKIMSIGIALIAFNLAWFVVPRPVIYWILLLAIVVLVWTASFGWRHALSILINWLQRLKQL